MGSSKKHKDKDRERRHKHRKHKSHDRSRSRSRGRRHGDDEWPRDKHEERKRQRDERDDQYDADQDVIQAPDVDEYEQNSAAAAPPSPVYAKQELTDEGYWLYYNFHCCCRLSFNRFIPTVFWFWQNESNRV